MADHHPDPAAAAGTMEVSDPRGGTTTPTTMEVPATTIATTASRGSDLDQMDTSSSHYGTIDRYGFIKRSQDLDATDGAGTENGGDVDDDDDGVDVDLIRRRELKWIEMIKRWKSYMTKDYDKVRSRCRKGIPASIRPQAWLHLCGAKFVMDDPEASKRFEQFRVKSFRKFPIFSQKSIK